ncbi:beta strand repeat-containing protein [Methylovulum psychrotolerans]|uniref:Haemolysin-type calcium binding-related domain-containing protein n=1 Tax=Methylovulum psychrotolerans TaxID=1704499 RepID=A0A1Z4C2M3_9GAMM|nr:calcium-binding protein [Methylovulum psychrotolerans]ASF47759.1 hypothetical protein CEK71_17735 [Methylovulum psychrotolerans]
MATYNGDTSQASTAGSTLNGTAGNDNLYGTSGNDIFNGGTGNDLLVGGLGDDTYLIAKNAGVDTIYDTGGTDVVKFTNMLASDISQVSSANYGSDLLLSYGSSQLTIQHYFDSANNRIEQFQFSDGTVWGWADIEAHLKLTGTSGDDTLYGTNDGNDSLNGLAGNDTLLGYKGNDTLNGGTGNDQLIGGLGDDTYLIAKNDGVDEINDDGGTDVVKFTDLLATDISQVSHTGFYGTDLLLGYGSSQLTVLGYFISTDYREQFQFSDGTVWGWADIKAKIIQTPTNGDDSLYGYDDSNDTLNGLAGNDTLYGFGGNDILNGGTGNDQLIGGLGNDTYLIAKNDGLDTIRDDGGTDVVKFTNMLVSDISQVSSDGITLSLSYGSSQLTVQGYFNLTDYRIEQFQFSDGTVWDWADISLKVSQGTGGDDILYGYDNSNDTLNGFAGNDTLYGNGGPDSSVLNKGNDILNGGTGNDELFGGDGNDTYLIAKNDGMDIIGDMGGTDVVKFTDMLATDISQVSRGYDHDLVLTYGSSQLTIGGYFYSRASIEQFQFSDGTVWGLADIKAHISLTGTSGNDSLSGYDDSNDTLNGLGGNDTLWGYSGNDSLNGGSGDDYLDGGYGFDVAQYYTATAGVTVNLNLNLTAQNTIGAGIDTLTNIEAVNGSAFNDTLTGDGYDNSLFGGVGNDILAGGDGNDSLVGGVGNDVLDGGNGFDIAHYYTATAGVTVNLNLTAAQNTLGAGFDTLTNIEAVNGSAFNDTLTGNAANNSLLGGKGNDVLDGGLGKDVLTGGLGQDSFVFDTALGLGNVDIISDFTVADDTVQLAHSVFSALSLGGLAADQFKIVGTGGVVDGNDHVLYNSASGVLSYDSDGSGAGAAVLVAILGKSLAMTAADFMVV